MNTKTNYIHHHCPSSTMAKTKITIHMTTKTKTKTNLGDEKIELLLSWSLGLRESGTGFGRSDIKLQTWFYDGVRWWIRGDNGGFQIEEGGDDGDFEIEDAAKWEWWIIIEDDDDTFAF